MSAEPDNEAKLIKTQFVGKSLFHSSSVFFKRKAVKVGMQSKKLDMNHWEMIRWIHQSYIKVKMKGTGRNWGEILSCHAHLQLHFNILFMIGLSLEFWFKYKIYKTDGLYISHSELRGWMDDMGERGTRVISVSTTDTDPAIMWHPDHVREFLNDLWTFLNDLWTCPPYWCMRALLKGAV